jgi:hypothetical protein
MSDSQILLLILSWLAYFSLHSLLASIWVKQFVALRWPRAMPAYRLVFNLLAVLLLAVPLGLTLNASGPWIWRWSGLASGVAVLLSAAAAAVVGFLWTLKFYDGREFLGLRQLNERNTSVDDQEQFQLSPLHRWVRYHGEIYRRYRQRVPGLFPLPWKYLRDSDVQALAGDRE